MLLSFRLTQHQLSRLRFISPVLVNSDSFQRMHALPHPRLTQPFSSSSSFSCSFSNNTPTLPHLLLPTPLLSPPTSFSRPLSSSARLQFPAASSSSSRDPYVLLGVPRTATDQEIKLSYLRLAKTCHPDLNPGDPTATLRFQELSAAYQAIKDADSRRDHRTQASYAPQQDVSDAKATFSGVMHDMNMIYEVVSWTYDEFKLDMADLSDALQTKDYDRAKSILSDYKYAGVAIVITPLLLLPGPRLFLMAVAASMRIFFSYFVTMWARNPRIASQGVARIWQGIITRVAHRHAAMNRRRR